MKRFDRKKQGRINQQRVSEEVAAAEETWLAIEAKMEKREEENQREMKEFLRDFPEERRREHKEDMDALDRAQGHRGMYRAMHETDHRGEAVYRHNERASGDQWLRDLVHGHDDWW